VEEYKREFIEFMVRSRVLLFGDFVTKSGRSTPFFINTGKYETGRQMERLGRYYAQAAFAAFGTSFNMLFGPAYKGIPLAVTTAVALARDFNSDRAVCFNRKEAKDHGEGGNLIGHKPVDGDRVLIIEDVTTAGTSIRESVALLSSVAKVTYAGVIVSVDRMERGTGEKSALSEIRDQLGIAIRPIVTLDEIVGHLTERTVDGVVVVDREMRKRIDRYREKYGAVA